MIVSYANFLLARAVWEEFSLKQHSRHIATLSALACLAQLISDKKPRKVVELGGGIGTMTELLARHPNAPTLLATLEDSPICLPSLRRVIDYSGPITAAGLTSVPAWKIVKTPTELTGYNADLLIVDGGYCSPPELNVIRDGTIVFCEGNRDKERATITKHCVEAGLNITFANEFIERRGQPDTSEKSCWIGTAIKGGLL